MRQAHQDATNSALIDDQDKFQRYAGLHSYCDHPLDSVFFFGRDVESKALEARIRAERCLVMFGRSGLGKTSLLKASVFPALRKQHFFPFIVRLNEQVKDLKRAVLDALQQACDRSSEFDLVPGDSDSGLWLYFRSTDIWFGDGVMTPVLVFDQFEEIFTHHDEAFRIALARELRELVDPTPRRVIHRLREQGKAGSFEAESVVDLRVVLSMREEYLAELEELVKWVPSLLDQRYRVMPMGRASAKKAITKPAAMDVAYALRRLDQLSEPTADASTRERLRTLLEGAVRFRFTDGSNGTDDALSMLLDALVDRRDEIDLTMLQTVCRNLETRVLQIADPEKEFIVDSEFLGSKEDLLAVWHRYYRNALDVLLDRLRRLPGPSATSTRGAHIERRPGLWAASKRIVRGLIPGNQRDAARKLCEFGLLSDAGNRISLVEDIALNDYGVRPDSLALLQRNRLIRKDTRPGLKGFYYELSHDRLSDVVFDERRRSIKKQWAVQLGLGVGATAALLFAVYAWVEGQAAREDARIVGSAAQKAVNATLFGTDKVDALLALNKALDSLAGISDTAGASKPAAASTAAPPVNASPVFRDPFLDGSGRQGPPLVAIPKGTFLMGSASEGRDNERPQHPVSIDHDFHAAEHELTMGEYANYADSQPGGTEGRQGCATLSSGVWILDPEASWRNPGFEQNKNHPVVCVSWQDVRGYADWLTRQTGHCYRLPSEAEWEYAARGMTQTQFWWGNQMRRDSANCITCGGDWAGRGTAPVGSFPANAFQLRDTAGNVFEWVADCYRQDYRGAPADGTAWESEQDACDQRILRGGAWLMGSDAMRSAYRQPLKPSERSALVGVRLVRTDGPCPQPPGGG